MSSGMTCDECVARGLGHRRHDRLWRCQVGGGWTCAEHTIQAGARGGKTAFADALRKLSDEAIRRGHLAAGAFDRVQNVVIGPSIERTTFTVKVRF